MPKFGGTAPDLSAGVTIVQYLLIGLILLLLGFLAYKLFPLFAPRFRRRDKPEKQSRVIGMGNNDEDGSPVSGLNFNRRNHGHSLAVNAP